MSDGKASRPTGFNNESDKWRYEIACLEKSSYINKQHKLQFLKYSDTTVEVIGQTYKRDIDSVTDAKTMDTIHNTKDHNKRSIILMTREHF